MGLKGDWRGLEGGGGSEGGERGVMYGGAGVEEVGAVSDGALGLTLEGWSHKYCCTSSVSGSTAMDDSKLRTSVDI